MKVPFNHVNFFGEFRWLNGHLGDTETTGKGQILQLVSVADYCRDGLFSGDIIRKMFIEMLRITLFQSAI